MLNIKIICVGKFKEKYWEAASAEYMKRLGAYCNISVIEVKEEKPNKKAEADLLKAQNQAKQLELDERKLEFEIEEAKAKREFESKKLDLELKKLENDRQLEEKKIEIEADKNEIERQKAENDDKNAKKERTSGYIKAGIGLAGVAVSTAFSAWAFLSAMKFEESGSFRTSVGKIAQGFTKGTASKLENVKKEM